MEIKLFNTTLSLKDFSCAMKNCKTNTVDPYVNIYVRITNKCNANCMFCEFANNSCTEIFDIQKFKAELAYINNTVRINKLSFTGGEPALDFDLLKTCIEYVKELNPSIFVVVNTNGFNIDKLLTIKNKINSIALSRHHYDDNKNFEILGTKTNIPTLKQLSEYSDDNKSIIHLSCTMVKGYIDESNISKYLSIHADIGILEAGIVSLMPINDFCKSNVVDFSDLEFYGNCLQTTEITKYDGSCKCANFLYSTENGNIIKFYGRFVCNMESIKDESSLVFDINKFRVGFTGRFIS